MYIFVNNICIFKFYFFGENIRFFLKLLIVNLILRENLLMVIVLYILFFFRFGFSNRFDIEFLLGLVVKV